MDKYIYENITEFKTPVGYFFVTDGKNNIPFSIRKRTLYGSYPVYDEARVKVIGEINTETKFDLVIDTNKLEAGCCYNIGFSNGIFSYEAADEYTEAITTAIGNWCVGIGLFNPNEDIQEQAIDGAEFSREKDKIKVIYPSNICKGKYVRYLVSSAFDSEKGFDFCLLDYSSSEIVFSIAWIEIDKYCKEVYEEALGYWLT